MTKSVAPNDGGILKVSIKRCYVVRVVRMARSLSLLLNPCYFTQYPRAKSELRSHKVPSSELTKLSGRQTRGKGNAVCYNIWFGKFKIQQIGYILWAGIAQSV